MEQAFGIWGGRVLLAAGQEGARVNQERGRIESAGQWKLPRRKGLKLWEGRVDVVVSEEGKLQVRMVATAMGTGCARAAGGGKRRSEHDKSGCGWEGFPLEKLVKWKRMESEDDRKRGERRGAAALFLACLCLVALQRGMVK